MKAPNHADGIGICSLQIAEAVRCAEEFGFTRRRVLWRMRRGEMMENNDAMVYAIAGFELG